MSEDNDDQTLALPPIDGADDEPQADPQLSEHDGELPLTDVGQGDAYEDENATDIPLDLVLATEVHESSAIGDDDVGLNVLGDDDIGQLPDDASLLDEDRGHAEEGMGTDGEEELGIAPIPQEIDDGGLDGLRDPGAERVDTARFPALDGSDDDDDDDEVDIGLNFEEFADKPDT